LLVVDQRISAARLKAKMFRDIEIKGVNAARL
jgi:hypothetical protein